MYLSTIYKELKFYSIESYERWRFLKEFMHFLYFLFNNFFAFSWEKVLKLIHIYATFVKLFVYQLTKKFCFSNWEFCVKSNLSNLFSKNFLCHLKFTSRKISLKMIWRLGSNFPFDFQNSEISLLLFLHASLSFLNISKYEH